MVDRPRTHRAPLADSFGEPEISASAVVHHGIVWDVVEETFTLPESPRPITREFVRHTGAVAVAAVDAADRILLIRQYRHPVRAREWEIPAGLLDIAGEPPWRGAARELAEEADLRAETWHVLADQLTSPGGLSESIRIYLARDVSAVEATFEREAEERGIEPAWVGLDTALAAVLDGRIQNATCQLAILHAHHARARGWTDLRPVDAPWPAREVAPGIEQGTGPGDTPED
ncbi:NUDIX hydrolase [Brevibacterium litoralis]|uniref:NUDIX hydrolase n=1 Tax=Brevibacterium litoralis TaxID=3138935 RepID=UPI0032EB13D3